MPIYPLWLDGCGRRWTTFAGLPGEVGSYSQPAFYQFAAAGVIEMVRNPTECRSFFGYDGQRIGCVPIIQGTLAARAEAKNCWLREPAARLRACAGTAVTTVSTVVVTPLDSGPPASRK